MAEKSSKVEWEVNQDVPIIVDRLVNKVSMFSFFEGKKIFYITTRGKAYKKPIKVVSCRHPYYTATDPYVYIFEVYGDIWSALTQKQKNLSVYHAMCSIPSGGFDIKSKSFGKKLSYDYELYEEEYKVAGVPDWMENPEAEDPLGSSSDGKKRVPITKGVVEKA